MKEYTVAYVRASTREQAQSGFTIQGQIRMVENYAKDHGYTLLSKNIFVDAGKSGLKEERPALDQMLKLVSLGLVERIIIKKSDRLSRIIKQREQLMTLFYSEGIVVEGVQEYISWATADDRANARTKAVNDQAESERISERTLDGLKESALQGNYPRSMIPIGYRKKGKKLIIHEQEARIIKEIFNKLAYEDFSIKKVITWLKAKKVLNKPWHKVTVANLVHNPIYCGTLQFPQNKPKIIVENHSPAIISKELFEKVQLLINRRNRNYCYTYFFKNLVYCKECNKLMLQESSVKPRRVYLYYFCDKCGLRINQDRIYEDAKNIIQATIYHADEKKRANNLLNKQNK